MSKPIFFNTEMVKAILSGRKTQTRRVIKDIDKWDKGCLWDQRRIGKPIGEVEFYYYDNTKIEPPYGRPGDSLWVRETWSGIFQSSEGMLQYRNIDRLSRTQEHCVSLFYKATDDDLDYNGCWVPSIYMPRWASRITLEVVKVRVERVQDISPADCLKEGITDTYIKPFDIYTCKKPNHRLRGDFARLWDSINAKRGYGWDINPWVFVYEFRRKS